MTSRWIHRLRPGPEAATWLATALLALLGSLYPAPGMGLLHAVAGGALSLLPVVLLAALLAGALTLGDWTDRACAWVEGGPTRAVVLASVAGTLTPVCGLGVLPLIAALLRRGLPLAPVMAFWVSSPVMGPSMIIVTIGVLGLPFAIAKTLAALGTGLIAGAVTASIPALAGPGNRLMRTAPLESAGCESPASGFWREVWSSTRLVARWLALALVLEVLIQRHVPQEWIAGLFAEDRWFAVPLAAIVGAPLYLDGFAALPLVRGLLDLGMGFGAALALLVSGAAVSLYAAVAVVSLVRFRIFVLYVGLAMLGACTSGYVADLLL
ncbi:MAG: permease [Halofilum sp. (in: g-proteobacteria)]|nr:permease [Halofilum sp. (in: g-proteobacteria)]